LIDIVSILRPTRPSAIQAEAPTDRIGGGRVLFHEAQAFLQEIAQQTIERRVL
jgi:hypothetical protein